MGTMVVATAGAAELDADPLLVKPQSKKYLIGKARDPSELADPEADVEIACYALAFGLRQAAKGGANLEEQQAAVLQEDALKVLLDKSADVLWKSQRFPILQRRNVNSAF